LLKDQLWDIVYNEHKKHNYTVLEYKEVGLAIDLYKVYKKIYYYIHKKI